MSCHSMLYHTLSCHVCHVMSCHIINHIILYYIINSLNSEWKWWYYGYSSGTHMIWFDIKGGHIEQSKASLVRTSSGRQVPIRKQHIKYGGCIFDIYYGILNSASGEVLTHWRKYASVNQQLLVQIMACRLFGAKPLSEPMLEYC